MPLSRITTLSARRKARLEESLKFFEFLRDSEEEESWLVEKQRIAKSMGTGRDLRSVISMQQKHAVSCEAEDGQVATPSGMETKQIKELFKNN